MFAQQPLDGSIFENIETNKNILDLMTRTIIINRGI